MPTGCWANDVLTLTMLPARQGDCIWIEYGPPGGLHHLVIDGGPESSDRLREEVRRRRDAAPGGVLHIDLLVVTHIDNDHIGGVLRLLANPLDGVSFGDIWFNGYKHLPERREAPDDLLGADQADRLSLVLSQNPAPWNCAFAGGAVVIGDTGPLPRIARKEGLTLTLMGPTEDGLRRLAGEWKNAKSGEAEASPASALQDDLLGRSDPWPPKVADLARARFTPDRGAPNGSSIVLLLEYREKRILLCADAFADQVIHALGRLPIQEERLRLDACKISHHGSRKSVSNTLLDRLACPRWLISTDGSVFGHPDAEAMARLIMHGGRKPELIFNSKKPFALRWSEAGLQSFGPFTATYPDADENGVSVRFDGTDD